MKVHYVPEGQSPVSPYLFVDGAADLLAFIEHVFHGVEREKMLRPDGAIQHAEVMIGNSIIMLAETPIGGVPMPATVHVYLRDCDEAYCRALCTGATPLREPSDQFYGDRAGGVIDQFGNQWWMATHIEDLSPEEIQRRAFARSAG